MNGFNQQYRHLVEHASAGIFYTGTDGLCAYTNSAWQEIFQLNFDQALGKGWSGPLHPADKDRVINSWLNAVKHSQSYHIEFRLLLKSADVRFLHVNAKPIYDEKGVVTGYVGCVQDMTLRQLTEQQLARSEERLALALQGSNAAIWDWDIENNRLYYDDELINTLGYQKEELERDSSSYYKRVHPDDIDNIEQALTHHLLNPDSLYSIQYRIKNKHDEYNWYQAEGKALRDKNDKAYRMVGSLKNISEEIKTQEKLNLASTVFEHSSEAILIVDKHGHMEAVNPAFCLLTGYEQDEVLGKHFQILNSEKNNKDLIKNMKNEIDKHGHWGGEIWSQRKNGENFAESIIVNQVLSDSGDVIRYIGLFTDITDKKQTQELIWKQAHYDNLTQLLNRHSFTQYLHQAVKKQQSFALLFIDLDHFKQINDTLGHNTGDKLLIEAARRLKHCVRESDIVARFGGDEFTVILTGIKNNGSIQRICHDIIKHLSQPFILNDENAYISASIGIAQFPQDSESVEDLYKYADQAMYDAKRLGRNRYAFFTQALQDLANKQRKISADLRIAIEENQFKVLYQPIIDLSDNTIYKAEALIRWLHPERGTISPADFIPIAEETGLIIEIGDWVFKQAAMQAKIFRKHYHPDFQISINKSPVQFYTGNTTVQENWSLFLRTINLPGNGITVEITEGLLLDSISVVKDKLTDFHQSGMQISLDDFGTGYSALSYLKKFDIDYIKIDQSFVKNIETDAYDLVLCETIISMAHKLGMKVIAEGIETKEQHQILLEASCDYGQGYLFSKPTTAENLAKIVQTYNK